MNAIQNPLVILAVLAWLTAPAGSLGEAAQKEAVRRQLVPKATVSLTNLGLPNDVLLPSMIPPASTPPVSTTPPDEDRPVTAPPPAAAGAAAPPPAAAGKQDEAYWRGRMNLARSTLDQDQTLAASLQSRINALQADVVNEDNPVKANKARADLQKTLGELDRMKKQITADQAAIQTIQDEARKADVPPGWIR